MEASAPDDDRNIIRSPTDVDKYEYLGPRTRKKSAQEWNEPNEQILSSFVHTAPFALVKLKSYLCLVYPLNYEYRLSKDGYTTNN